MHIVKVCIELTLILTVVYSSVKPDLSLFPYNLSLSKEISLFGRDR